MDPLTILLTLGSSGGLITGVITIIGWWRNRHVTSAQAELTEAQADKTVGEYWGELVRGLEARYEKERAEDRAKLASLQTAVDQMQAHQRERDGEMRRIRARNRALEDRVALLERTLRTHDLPIPPDHDQH